jgi:hypothetical protein
MPDSRADLETAYDGCYCTACTGRRAGRCEDCGGRYDKPADRGGCICDGPRHEPYWSTV